MKFLKSYYILIFSITSLFTNAQNINQKIFFEGGYTYTYLNRSFADVGVKLLFDKQGLTIGTNALINVSDNKILVIPEINTTKYFISKEGLPFPFVRLNVSPKVVSPQFGFSVVIADVGVGYGFGFNNSEDYKTEGFRVQLNFNIPLKWDFKLRIM